MSVSLDGTRKSNRAIKPPGFYQAVHSGIEINSGLVDTVYENTMHNSDHEGSCKEVSDDEELLELKRVEQEMTSQVNEGKKKLRSIQDGKKEEEKKLLRERIALLRDEANQIERALQISSASSSRSRHSSRSLPDSSEYQRLLDDIIKGSDSEQTDKSKTKAKTGKSKLKLRKDLMENFKKACKDKEGKIRMPSAKELKRLTVLAESVESENKEKSIHGESSDTSEDSSTVESSSDSDSKREKKYRKKKGKKGKKKIVSGRLENVDEADIIKPVKYPHSRLNTDFVRNKKFESLSFHHLVAGELELIARGNCGELERSARIAILKYLAYHFAYLDIGELLEQYDAIMKRVERGELDWDSSLGKKVHKSLTFRRETLNKERIIPEQKQKSKDSKEGKVKEKKHQTDQNKDELIYCLDFNKGKCAFSTSHMGKWSGREVMKLHVCRKCLSEDGVKKAHKEGDQVCPHHE